MSDNSKFNGLYNSVDRLEQKSRLINIYACFIGVAVITFAMIMIFQYSRISEFLFVLVFAVIILCGIRISGIRNEYKVLYKEIFVEEPIKKNFEDATYLSTYGFTENDVKNFGITKMGNRFKSEDYIKASYMGVHFEVSDVTVEYHSSGKSSHTTTYFNGRMMTFDFPFRLAASVRVYSDSFKYRADDTFFGFTNNKDKIEFESIEFNNRFDVYSSSDYDAFYLITPVFMERLMMLSGKYGSIAMNVMENRVVVGFNEPGNDAFDPKNMTKEVSYPEEMEKIQEDIDDIKNIITVINNIHECKGEIV